MFRLRRYVIYLLAAATLLLVLQRLSQSTRVTAPASGGSAATSDSKQGQRHRPFKWKDLPVNYPVPAASLIPLPAAKPKKLPAIQHQFEPETARQASQRKSRQAAVKDAFVRCWKAYKDRAWMHDELSPLSGGFNDKFGGWGANVVDNLDTLWIMDLKTDFDQAVKSVLQIDTSDIKIDTLNVFETNIRHLGGLLAAYDLSGQKALLAKAVELGEMLLKPFDTPNHMPITRWDWQAAAGNQLQKGPEEILLAELGTLAMEYTRLSQLTGDPRWFSAVHNITLLFEKHLQDSQLPGMFPVTLDASGELDVSKDNWFTLNGMADSYYEYLPKMHLLLGGVEPVYRRLFDAAAETAYKHTIYRPMTPDNADVLFSGALRLNKEGNELHALQQHLGCFTGGMFTLAGKIWDEPERYTIGEKLTEGCIWSYNALDLGVMVEEFTVMPCKSKDVCRWDEALWRKEVQRRMELANVEISIDKHIAKERLRHGITSFQEKKYQLRPEAIESVFILYRMTGDQTLRDTAWKMFNSIMNLTTTEYANAAMNDVTLTAKEFAGTHPSSLQLDSMESFWMAETLKYFYLIFSEPSVISLDEYVFNTEAHPFRRPTPA